MCSGDPFNILHSRPWIAVVVPVRNRREVTRRFLESFSLQTYPNIRVIVVDSNSNDGTHEMIRECFPQSILLSAADNDFWAGATNLGVRHALKIDAQWILTINDDSLAPPDYAETILNIAIRRQCKILGGMITLMDKPDLIWSLGAYTKWGTHDVLRLGLHGLSYSQIQQERVLPELLSVDALPGNGVLIHRSVYEDIGLYNKAMLPHYHADSEFIMRAISRGIPAWATPKAALLNDFSYSQKRSSLRGPRRTIWTFSHPKSHLYLPALLYMIMRYCPPNLIVKTFISLLSRLLQQSKEATNSV